MDINVGDRIREIRTSKKLSQKQLGDACGIPDSGIRKYESGAQQPRIDTLQRLAEALNVTVIDFFQYELPPELVKLLADCDTSTADFYEFPIENQCEIIRYGNAILQNSASLKESGFSKDELDYVVELAKKKLNDRIYEAKEAQKKNAALELQREQELREKLAVKKRISTRSLMAACEQLNEDGRSKLMEYIHLLLLSPDFNIKAPPASNTIKDHLSK